MTSRLLSIVLVVATGLGLAFALIPGPHFYHPASAQRAALGDFDRAIAQNAQQMLDEGRRIFRYDTFGDEAWWGDTLKLHQAIEGAKHGGVGPGVSPKTALAVGLKVDMDALPADLVDQIKAGKVDLDDPATTLALLKINAVVGVTGFFNPDGTLKSMGIQCAVCHASVDNAFAPGIGHRLDGWGNRDLNVGAIVALAPNLKPIADLLGADIPTVKKVLMSWGPGRFDAELDKDGKAFRPDGKQAGTIIPNAFGLAGVNLHTWTGAWGTISYWNAYVANTEMKGKGTFFDPRLDDPKKYPVAARSRAGHLRNTPDLITAKLAALHFYQLSIPAPKPPDGSFDKNAAARGRVLFKGKARCATCHVAPLYIEPGWPLHTGQEIGIDDFQANRAPDNRYRTAPLRGLWTRLGGPWFYHDGRFRDLRAVVQHYDGHFNLNLSDQEINDLVEFLKSL
jgi:mono/diheme cytochrome c family protein